MTPAHEVLVAFGPVGVVRDSAGMLWLTDDVDVGHGTGIEDYRPGVQGLGSGKTLEGGRLPPGAVGAEVVDDTGNRIAAAAANGAWVVILDQPTVGATNPVRYVDGAGGTVASPLPADWPRTPLPQAGEECPACGATAWMEVLPLDGSRGSHQKGDGAWEPSPVVVCERCGHEVRVGVSLVAAADASDFTEADALRAEELQRRREREVLEKVRIPVYAARDRPGRLSGWAVSGSQVTSVSVATGAMAEGESDPWLEVQTLVEDLFEDEPALARDALRIRFHLAGDWSAGSEAELALRFSSQERHARAVAARLEPRTVAFAVDGEPRDFVLVESGPKWAAARRDGDLTLILTANGVAPPDVALERVADPLARLGG